MDFFTYVWPRTLQRSLIFIALMAGQLAGITSTFGNETGVRKAPVPLTYFGMHIHRADSGTPWPPFLFGSWRLWDANVGWSSLESEKGRWDFSRLDRYIAMAKITKVDVILVLGLTPTWASARPNEKSGYRLGNAAEPKDINDWRRYVRMVAERYKGRIPYYEIWNEPSEKTFFTGDISTLVTLTKEAYQIIKEVDPNAVVLSPANSGGGRDLEHYEKFLGLGGKRYFDIPAYHFYTWTSIPESMLPVLQELQAVLKRHGLQDRPVWGTEAGWWIENSDGTPEPPNMKPPRRKLNAELSQAYLARTLILARAYGLDRYYAYSWDNLHGIGMREPTSGAPKPVAHAYAKTVELMLGHTVDGCVESSGTWICQLSKAGNVTYVAWRQSGPAIGWTPPAAWKAERYRRLVDESWKAAQGEIRLGDMPIVISSQNH